MKTSESQYPALVTTFDNKNIDISKLTVNELWLLQYEQEKAFAGLIKSARAFSPERVRLMKEGYETVNKIMIMRSMKAGKQLDSYGSNDYYMTLVKRIINKVLQQKGKCVFFEAGIGTGKIINGAAALRNVAAAGCDIYIDRNYVNPGLNVYEGTIYDALSQLEDKSIDVFYWNDVIEHIPEDEIEALIQLLSQKTAMDGIIITITPNRLKGPCDITFYFEPHGTAAKGFHFHEYTFHELLTLFKKHNIISAYGILGYIKCGCYIVSSPKIIDKIKLTVENLAAAFPFVIRKILLVIMGCDVSILKKINNHPSCDGC